MSFSSIPRRQRQLIRAQRRSSTTGKRAGKALSAFTQTARIGFAKQTALKNIHEQFEGIKRQVLAELKKEMRPELLARLDQILVFNPLSETAIESITRLEIEKFGQTFENQRSSASFW